MSNAGRLVIRGLSTLSSIGVTIGLDSEIWTNSLNLERAPSKTFSSVDDTPIFPLADTAQERVEAIRRSSSFGRLDRVSLLGIAAARETFSFLKRANFDLHSIGCVALGSSRGATETLERSFDNFSSSKSISALTSPVTTAGNISSSVAQDLIGALNGTQNGSDIVSINTSMTCSSASHALMVARAFVLSGMTQAAIFGGAEACLTPYTIAQLKALRIYSEYRDSWPCRALDISPNSLNSVVLGEGAGTAVLLRLEEGDRPLPGDLELLGLGWAMEQIPSPTGISEDGAAFERAMRMAVAGLSGADTVAGVVMHAPGSQRGDRAELAAITQVFGEMPVYSTKHLTGHTYGSAPMLNLSLGKALLEGLNWRHSPYAQQSMSKVCDSKAGNVVLVNSAGFGGNAISIALRMTV